MLCLCRTNQVLVSTGPVPCVNIIQLFFHMTLFSTLSPPFPLHSGRGAAPPTTTIPLCVPLYTRVTLETAIVGALLVVYALTVGGTHMRKVSERLSACRPPTQPIHPTPTHPPAVCHFECLSFLRECEGQLFSAVWGGFCSNAVEPR